MESRAGKPERMGCGGIVSVALLLVFAMGLGLGGSVESAHASGGVEPMHVGVVLDSSGSMKQNDPDGLSLLGAMIFTDLMAPHDRVAVFTMVPGSGELVENDRVGDRKASIKEEIRSVPFETRTDCAGPLRRAAASLEEARALEREASQFVVFLSDGVCPVARDGTLAGSELERVLEGLDEEGVRVFTIGLEAEATGAADVSASRVLRWIAEQTGGRYFSAESAGKLPGRFAEILGQIRGSRAQTFELTPSGSGRFTLDGYVRDASVIVTGSGDRTILEEVHRPDGSAMSVPRPSGSRYSVRQGELYVAAGEGAGGDTYAAARIESPPAGNWNLQVAGAGDSEGLVIQNYALDPVLSLSSDPPLFVDSELDVEAWLRDREGERLEDADFLDQIRFELEVEGPEGEARTFEMKNGKEGVVERAVSFSETGSHTLRVRAAMKDGPLDKWTAPEDVEVSAVDLRVERADGVDLGDLKAGRESEAVEIDLSKSEIVGKRNLEWRVEGVGPVEPRPGTLEVDSETETVEVRFRPDRSHAGGEQAGKLRLRIEGAEESVPLRVRVVPLSFWERYGDSILAIALGLGLLLVLVFVVYGFVSPHRFPPHLRFNWGDDLERLDKNEMIIREVQGTGRGFYRNAEFVIGGRGSALSVGGAKLCVLEATGKNQVTIRAGEGVELCRVNKFDPDDETEVEGGEGLMSKGEVYRAGDLYLRIR